MSQYRNLERRASASLDAVTPVKLFTSRTSGSKGWRLYNPSATVSILFKCQKAGAAAPTYAEMVAGQNTYRVNPYATVEDAGAECDVYAAVTSGTLTVYPEELF